jgi:hypothetical protein
LSRTSRRAGDDDPVATSTLGLIESIVGKLEQEIAFVGRFLEGGYADRNRYYAGYFASPLRV